MMASTATVEVLVNLQLTVYIFPLFSPESFFTVNSCLRPTVKSYHLLHLTAKVFDRVTARV